MRKLLPCVAVALAGCFQSVSTGYNDGGPPAPPDDRLTLSAHVCTTPADVATFPVKVVLVVDQSGSMCISDPPGAQASPGFCDMALAAVGTIPTEPARVRAMKRLLTTLSMRPEVSVAMVPFATHLIGPWPSNGGFASLAEPQNYANLMSRVSSLQSELGKGSDLQGALEFARTLIVNDIARVELTDRSQLPRTRYVVVLLSDGAPFPRCSVNDNLPAGSYADPANPDRPWADSAGATSYCNTIDPADPEAIPGLVAGGDRNQNAQLFAEVDRLAELKAARRVGDIRFHTQLLFNAQAISSCGPICDDVFGSFTNVPPSQSSQAAQSVGRWLLQRLAERGAGTYSEATDSAALANLVLPQDYGSLVSQNQVKAFIVRPMTSVPGQVDRERDSDGDGLPDALEQATNAMKRDTDGDCFDDGFEVARAGAGFDPLVRDVRGCDPQAAATPGCVCRDVDGDGLSQFAEAFLGSSPTLVDSDADGVHDGLEARWRLDVLQPSSALFDTDSDTVSDPEEVRGGSDPLVADPGFRAVNTVKYSVTTSAGANGTTCYDFTVENLQRLEGSNLFHLEVAEAPMSNASVDYGVWRSACLWAKYQRGDGPGSATAADGSFGVPSLVTGAEVDSYASRCVGTPP